MKALRGIGQYSGVPLRASPPIFAAIALAALSRSAWAAQPRLECDESRVRILGRPDERWLEPIRRACDQLVATPDVDTTAQVRIIPEDANLMVLVTTSDGRSTVRRVTNSDELAPTLQALLELPPPPVVRRPPVAPAPPAPSTIEGPPAYAAPPTGAAVSGSELPRGFGVELGGAVGGRVSGGRGFVSLAPSISAQLRAGAWIFGIAARWEVLTWGDSDVDSFEMETVAAGVFAAHRFHVGFIDLDVGGSPRFVAETQGYTAATGERSATVTDIGLAAIVRATFGRSAVRVFTEIDAELFPDRLRRDIRTDPALPPLPAWSAGLGAGVAVGTP